MRQQAISGTKWTTISMAVQVIAQLLKLSVLTRFLEKSDFGLVAIVTLVLGFTHIFADLGVSVALFSKDQISKKEYSSLFWVSLLSGIFLYAVLVLFSPLVAGFYNLDILRTLIPIMGLDLIISTAGKQFKIFKQKSLQFKSISVIEIVSAILSLCLAIVLAINGYGVYSLIYSALLGSFIATLLFIGTSIRKYPIIFYVNIRENKRIYQVGLYQTGAQILDYLASQLDILLIGKIMGPTDLGVYNLVKQLVLRPYSFFTPILYNVAIPLLVKFNDQVSRLKENYLRVLSITAFANFLTFALIALFASEILITLYGRSYLDSVFILQMFCIWGSLATFSGAASIIVIIKGRTELGFKWTLIRLLTNPAFIIFGGIWGIEGIVIGQVTCYLLYMFLYWTVLINKVLRISFVEYTNTYVLDLLKSLAAFVVSWTFKWIFLGQFNLLINILIPTLIFSAIFFLLNRTNLKNYYRIYQNNV